jgi:nucleoside-diphosphate-sugar epimerase
MKILVLGATGFIGHNIAQYFSMLGHDVIGVSHIREAIEIPNVKWIYHFDLCSPDRVHSIFKDIKNIDVVIQAAATTSGSKDIVNTPAIHVTDNAIMNALIFRAAVDAKVRHVVFFSCTTMFRHGVVAEDSTIDIHDKYFGIAWTKLYNEKMCEFYSRIGDTKFTAIRHSNIYGPHDKFDLERSHVFGATIRKVMDATSDVTVWGSGEEARDLLYVDDLCSFVDAAIEKQPGKFGLYNCGYGHSTSINRLVDRIIATSRKTLQVKHDLTAPTIPTSLTLDCTKSRKELGWKPNVTLDEGIAKTIKWYKENIA